jgi:prevent-host-death family protein
MPTARTVAASAFKAKCLALLDEVQRTGVPLVVTKRGRAVAKLVPMGVERSPDLLGSVRYEREEDLLAPVDEVWDADR